MRTRMMMTMILLTANAVSHADTSATIALVSDYRFRGISQNWGEPSVQAGVEYVRDNGFYGGAWTATVSDDVFYDGSLELDLYAGWRWRLAGGVALDAGALRYAYPGANASLGADAVPADRFDTSELYFGVARGNWNVKAYYAVSDYFAINDAYVQNVGLCANTSGDPGDCASGSAIAAGRGGSDGTLYAELNYTFGTDGYGDIAVHAGHLAVANYGELDVSEFRLGWSRAVSWATLGLAWHAVASEAGYYRLTGRGGDVFATDDDVIVFSASASF